MHLNYTLPAGWPACDIFNELDLEYFYSLIFEILIFNPAITNIFHVLIKTIQLTYNFL